MDDSGQEKELFVLVKAKRRQSSKERLDTATTEALTLVKKAVQNYPTKELISFMKEMEKSRQRELNCFSFCSAKEVKPAFTAYPILAMNTDIMQILALTRISFSHRVTPIIPQLRTWVLPMRNDRLSHSDNCYRDLLLRKVCNNQ